MTDTQSIAVIKNMIFSLNNTLRYRKEKGDNIIIDEYMLPEALENVVSMAEKQNASQTINKIINKEPK